MAETKIINKVTAGLNRHWKNFFDKDYLGSHNLEQGEEMLLTIENFVGEEMVQKVGGGNNEKTPKPVLYFKEDVPKMIMNITNGNIISSLYGPHPEQWIGKQIQVFSTPVRAFGKTQDALRIRDFIPRINVDITPYVTKLSEAKTVEDLKNIWVKFPVSARDNKELVAKKDAIKNTLAA